MRRTQPCEPLKPPRLSGRVSQLMLSSVAAHRSQATSPFTGSHVDVGKSGSKLPDCFKLLI
ncbi:MAG: hypothetical protein ACK53Y_11710, partial [bacterium]